MGNTHALNKEELKENLTLEQYKVLREKGIKAPFNGEKELLLHQFRLPAREKDGKED